MVLGMAAGPGGRQHGCTFATGPHRVRLALLPVSVLVLAATACLGLAGCATDPDVDGIQRRTLDANGTAQPPQPVATMPPPRRDGVLRLRPGDQVDVSVWGYDDLSRRATVAPDGGLAHPLAGRVQAGGRTPDETAELLRVGLRPMVREAVVRVSVAVPAPVRCQVLGEVKNPGPVALTSTDATLLEALAGAGGLTENARKRIVLIRELDGQVYLQGLDMATLVSGGLGRQQMGVGEGDTLFVPSARSADAAREARRWADMLAPLLSFQQATLLFDSFLKALVHGNPTSTNTIVVPGNP